MTYLKSARHQLIGACIALMTVLPGPLFAGSDDIVVEQPWARASVGTSRPGVAYLVIRNTGDTAMALTAIRTEVSMMPELHRTTTDADGVSSMAPAGDIEIAPGASVALEPGGLHAMLMKLKQPLIKGESFPMTLIFGDGSEVIVEVPVLAIGARGPGG